MFILLYYFVEYSVNSTDCNILAGNISKLSECAYIVHKCALGLHADFTKN